MMKGHGDVAMTVQVEVSGTPGGLGFVGLRGPDPREPADHEKGSDAWSGAAHERILLVEDDRSIREALRGILEDEGYAVTTADNGRRALEHLRSGEAPDLIVLDLRMPIMDGWEFRAMQKADPVLSAIPVLAISADGSAKAAAIDAAAYLRKPLSTGVMLNAIRRILGEAERKRLLGRLEEAERFAALGRLAASVGHEINNPLAYVSMNLDLVAIQFNRYRSEILAPAEDLADVGVMLKECRGGLDRIRDIVKDLQRLSRRPGATREMFSLNTLLDESLAMARNHVQHRAIVQKHYADLPMIAGDRSAIGQVMLNLILNAAQALPDGRAESHRITLRTRADEGVVIIEVGDTGPGIPIEVLPHIFDPFFSTKPIGDATGLGLAVSYRIVADHGGRIEVDSEEGRGSLFRVLLPIAALPSFVAVPPAKDVAPVMGRILVIDDAPAIGRAIADALPEHKVTVVLHAPEAFARLSAGETFDVILCDLMMPQLGGRDVLERLEAEWPHLVAAVIFMTGGAFTTEAREFLSRTKEAVLLKPFSMDQLRTTIMMHLQARIRERN
jgi:signal transduction histidine kinase